MIHTVQAKVGDVMSKNILFAHPNHKFTELCRLFYEMDIHHLPVVDEDFKLIGMLSSNDVLKAYSFKVPLLDRLDEETLNSRFTIYDLMTPAPLICVNREATLTEASALITDHHIHALPVMDGDRIVGIITSTDIVRRCAELEETP